MPARLLELGLSRKDLHRPSPSCGVTESLAEVLEDAGRGTGRARREVAEQATILARASPRPGTQYFTIRRRRRRGEGLDIATEDMILEAVSHIADPSRALTRSVNRTDAVLARPEARELRFRGAGTSSRAVDGTSGARGDGNARRNREARRPLLGLLCAGIVESRERSSRVQARHRHVPRSGHGGG